MHLWCGGIFSDLFIVNLLLSVPVKELFKISEDLIKL